MNFGDGGAVYIDDAEEERVWFISLPYLFRLFRCHSWIPYRTIRCCSFYSLLWMSAALESLEIGCSHRSSRHRRFRGSDGDDDVTVLDNASGKGDFVPLSTSCTSEPSSL